MKSWTLENKSIKSNLNKDLSLKIYDSRSNRINMIDRSDDAVEIYVCGITPYDSAHLGHAFTYISFDLMIRVLNFIGITTNYVQNITDIDDPLFERAKRDDQEWENIVSSQMEIYRSDMKALQVLPPNHFVGVLENMELIIQGISTSLDKNLSYQIGSEWYFKTDPNKRSLMVKSFKEEELVLMAKERGCDTDRVGKINPIDPILWKASKTGEPIWKEKFGDGRPGWHIQCISLANEYSKLPLDIQGGGKDLIFPHHSMCEEQSSALGYGDLALNYCHVGMVSYQGSKMSKSKGNLVFVHDLINQGISPMVIRICLMMQHWQNDWEYTSELLKNAEYIYKAISKNLSGKYFSRENIEQILEMCVNNLDIPKVLEFLNKLKPQDMGDENMSIDLVLESLLGITLESAA